MPPNITIRPERPNDLPAIHDLIRVAFGRELEAEVVTKLRASAGFLPGLSLVAEHGDQIIGHVMITELVFQSDAGRQVRSTILAPLAVLPSHQNQGIGDALSRAAIERSREAGYGSMILVGHPNYYPRFGFLPASTWGIRYATPIRDEVFMALELVPGALADAAGTVHLPAAFDGA
jgi:putative acetyltransferase